MSWNEKYKLKNVKPGKIHTRQFGVLDFSKDNIPVEKCDRLVKEGFPYLEAIQAKKTNSESK